AVEDADVADGLGAVVVETKFGYRSLSARGEDGRGQEGLEDFFAGHGAGAGAAAAVRGGEGLVQVEVHDVDDEVAGAGLAAEGVYVGAVHVEECALGVEDVGDLVDLGLKDADGGGVGEHEGGGVGVDHAGELGEVHHACRVGLEVGDLITDDRGGRGIRPVGGVGDEDLFARVAVGLVEGTGEQDAGELAVRAGGGLEGDGVHAGDFDEALREELHDAEAALGEGFGLVGVRVGDAFEAGDGLVDAWVVLHGAGAKRIHAEVDRVVPGGEAGGVADDL